MNTSKAYRMLIVALFFIFVSLVSRSIIYLVLSVAIATIIIFLLSSHKKAKKLQANANEQVEFIETKNKSVVVYWITAIIGGLVIGYGSLFFTENTIFHQFLPLPEQLLVAFFITVSGFSVALISLYILIRNSLSMTSNKKLVSEKICKHCGVKNNPNHTYCHSCGEKV